MGVHRFPSCADIPKTIYFSILLNLPKFMVWAALTQLGVFNNNPPQQQNNSEEMRTPPSQAPPADHILTAAAIKNRLRVVEHGEYLNIIHGVHEEQEEDDVECSVCLRCVERSHEMRELTNCSHVFHRECLDHWVDVGHVTCPLCRSMLFPN